MSPARALGLIAALCAAGCGHEPPAARALPSPSAASPLATLLAARCAPCHDGQPDRPRLEGERGLDRRLAMRAALMVSAGRMPPPPALLRGADRHALIDGFCRYASQPATCVHTFTADLTAPIVMPPQQIAVAVDAIVDPSPSGTASEKPAQLSPATQMLFGYAAIKRLEVRLDPTMETLLVLLATERCPAPDPARDGGGAAFDRCARAILDSELIQMPSPPAPATGGSGKPPR